MEKKNWVKTYLFIWAGQFVSLLTSSAVNFAVVIWLSMEFKSAEILAYSAIAALLPQAIIGPFAGVYIDRWNRKKVMIFAMSSENPMSNILSASSKTKYFSPFSFT